MEVPFERVLFALGIRYVGEQTAKEIVLHFHNIDNIIHASKEEIAGVKDVGEVIAQSVYDYMHSKDGLEQIDRLRKDGLHFEIGTQPTQVSNALEGKTIVISGNFSISREEIKELISRNGGKNSSSISSKTSFLLAGTKPGPEKINKCKELGIKVLDEAEFRSLLPTSENTPVEKITEFSLF